MTTKENIIAFFDSLKKIPFLLSTIGVFIVLYDIGFDQSVQTQTWIYNFYFFTCAFGSVSIIFKTTFKRSQFRFGVFLFDSLSFIYMLSLYILSLDVINRHFFITDNLYKRLLIAAVFLFFIRKYSALKLDLKKTILEPAQIFILSFLFLIITGGLLFMLPNATYNGISPIDAMFTSASAVCVTGLSTVDTGTTFTGLGLTILATLIQIGGLGIMTFASYFSYFFRGVTSYENQLVVSDMSSVDKLSEVFGTLKSIIQVTFLIELIGATFIFFNINTDIMPNLLDRIYFSIFHSISGFCNAGFSTLANNFYELEFRFNYPIHLTIAGLITFGGLGFPIVFNLTKYVKHLIQKRLSFNKENIIHVPWVINLNTRIVIITSFLLLVLGTTAFYILEYDNVLREHSWFGKIVVSFFGAVTPRTAGFNVVDMTALSLSTIIIMILLMWIGASPASTGGGIKTTTFAVAVLNFISLARGKNRIEIYRREIADISVRRAFAIITLSLLIIGVATLLIASFEQNKNVLHIAFECFSAYSTVGLSIGLTSTLTSVSKFVLIVVMFIGRVSMLSILIAIVSNEKYKNYRYPTEELLIN